MKNNPFNVDEIYEKAMAEYRKGKEETAADILEEFAKLLKINRQRINYLSTNSCNAELKLEEKFKAQLEFYTKAVVKGTIDPTQARNIIYYILENEHNT